MVYIWISGVWEVGRKIRNDAAALLAISFETIFMN